MSTQKSPDRFAEAVMHALRTEIAKAAEEEIAAANERVNQRVRMKIAEIATSIFKRNGTLLDFTRESVRGR